MLIGLPGERDEDDEAMADLLAHIAPDILRVNFFFPIVGVRLAERFTLPPAEHIFRLVCFLRIAFPCTPLYLGAGRSLWLSDMRREAEELANGIYSEQRFLNHSSVDVV